MEFFSSVTEPFVLRAFAAGALVAAAAGALGCFIVWRRMAYFGDSIAHCALLGAALGLVAGAHINAAMTLVCMALAALLSWLRHKQLAEMDALLGIFAHAALAFGVLIVALSEQSFDLHAYLLGDILFITDSDLLWTGTVALLAFLFLAARWRALALMTVSEDLAASEGIHPLRENMALAMLTAMAVSVSARIVGVLLVASLLIIPAAAARQFASSPVAAAAFAVCCGVLSVAAGITLSLHTDAPAGPAIAAAAFVIFVISIIGGKRRYF